MGFKSSLIRSGTKLLQTFSGIDIGKSLGASSGSPDDGFDFRISPHLTGYDSPLLPGTTLWNLSSMGDLVIDGYNDGERYSITNISTRAKHIQMWGEGASPGGNGGYSYGDFNPASLGGRGHWFDQSQLPGSDRLCDRFRHR